jgi:hypothetical protein
MKKLHAGSGIPHGHLNRGTERKPNPFHAGSGRPHGRIHEAPTLPQVNSANYGAQKVGKRKK